MENTYKFPHLSANLFILYQLFDLRVMCLKNGEMSKMKYCGVDEQMSTHLANVSLYHVLELEFDTCAHVRCL